MQSLMVPLHDGSGFAEIGSLVKWAPKPFLDGQMKRMERYGAGPFIVLDSGYDADGNWLHLFNPHGKDIRAKPEWLVPAKSLLTATLDGLTSAASCGFESPTERIKSLHKILLSADLTAAEKSLAIARLKEIISCSGKRNDRDLFAHEIAAKELINALQKK